ncbi:MAG: gliding motility protein GldB [Flavobacteriaceae bacterium]|jgi:hypothetical protein|nr:gliding motility protein GldB [Flavobacteriaceae bacterium]
MKFLKYLIIVTLVLNCSKESENNERWNVDVSKIEVNTDVVDISDDFYNLQMSIPEFRKKYPFYLDADYPDSEYDKQRRDTTELNIYAQIKQKIDSKKIKSDMTNLFRHIKYYYPDFKEPKVFLYSSFIQDYLAPVTYVPEQNYLFIASDCFLGYGNKYYDLMKIDRYLQRTMDPSFLSSKAAGTIIKKMSWIPGELTAQSFISQMIYQGKILIMEDAFLPDTDDCYKLGYTKEQIDWAKSNEFEIWNFFIQNNYIFSDDISLADRFLSIAPFSKFYTEADAKSPGQIGNWIGWQISRKYLTENPKVSLQEFIKNPNHEEIFARSKYKPQQTGNNDQEEQ